MRHNDFNPDCTCMQYGAFESIALWRARAFPIVSRLLKHGHRVDPAGMTKTLDLVATMETGKPACFSLNNAHRSHHLKTCPVAARNAWKRVR